MRVPSPIAAIAQALDERFGRRADPPSLWPVGFGALLSHAAIVAFLVLTVTGIALSLVYRPSVSDVTYHGASELYDGQTLPAAFATVVRISEDLPGGLLLRRLHVAAAHLFMLAIVAHLLRTLATGAFRRPRMLTHVTGVGLLLVALGFTYTGELLPFGLVAGSSLRIAEAVLFSLPFAGEQLGTFLFEHELPSQRFMTLAWVTHVFLLPPAFVALLWGHMALVLRRGPALARRPDVDVAGSVVGRRLWPDAVARFTLLTTGLTALLLASAVVVPWADLDLEGPFRTAEATNSVHPPWPLFFLTGGLRILPAVDVIIGGMRITNVLIAGVVLPTILIAGIALYPFIERRLLGDREEHHVLDHPFDVPLRAGTVTALTALAVVLSFGAGVDVLAFWLDVRVEGVVWTFRGLLVALPVLAGVAAVAASRRRARARRAGAPPAQEVTS
jgi:quinol-cytochrome oxidoreductase complex cytochrome b subunit